MTMCTMTNSWQKWQRQHKRQREMEKKQPKTWTVAPEEGENDITFTGWARSCEKNKHVSHLWVTPSNFTTNTTTQNNFTVIVLTQRLHSLHMLVFTKVRDALPSSCLILLVLWIGNIIQSRTFIGLFCFGKLVNYSARPACVGDNMNNVIPSPPRWRTNELNLCPGNKTKKHRRHSLLTESVWMWEK